MRIGVVGPVSDDYFAENVAASLLHMGIDAIELGPPVPDLRSRVLRTAVSAARRASRAVAARLERGLIESAIEKDCDLILSVDSRLSPEAVRTLRSTGMKVCLWFPDAISNLGDLSMFSAPYSAYFFKDPLLVSRLNDVYGLPAHFLPEACNPQWHRPVGVPGSDPHIAVVGNIYPTRVHLLERLMDEGIPLRLHSGGRPKPIPGFRATELPVGSFVAKLEKSRVFHQARAVLNNLHPGEMTSVNCRLFEATAAGGVVLCEERPTLRDVFVPGLEVASFGSLGELVDLAKTAMASPEQFMQMRHAASSRAHNEHTYGHRLRELLDQVG